MEGGGIELEIGEKKKDSAEAVKGTYLARDGRKGNFLLYSGECPMGPAVPSGSCAELGGEGT